MPEDRVVLKKKGGYSGGKRGELMRPPVQSPAAVYLGRAVAPADERKAPDAAKG